MPLTASSTQIKNPELLKIMQDVFLNFYHIDEPDQIKVDLSRINYIEEWKHSKQMRSDRIKQDAVMGELQSLSHVSEAEKKAAFAELTAATEDDFIEIFLEQQVIPKFEQEVKQNGLPTAKKLFGRVGRKTATLLLGFLPMEMYQLKDAIAYCKQKNIIISDADYSNIIKKLASGDGFPTYIRLEKKLEAAFNKAVAARYPDKPKSTSTDSSSSVSSPYVLVNEKRARFVCEVGNVKIEEKSVINQSQLKEALDNIGFSYEKIKVNQKKLQFMIIVKSTIDYIDKNSIKGMIESHLSSLVSKLEQKKVRDLIKLCQEDSSIKILFKLKVFVAVYKAEQAKSADKYSPAFQKMVAEIEENISASSSSVQSSSTSTTTSTTTSSSAQSTSSPLLIPPTSTTASSTFSSSMPSSSPLLPPPISGQPLRERRSSSTSSFSFGSTRSTVRPISSLFSDIARDKGQYINEDLVRLVCEVGDIKLEEKTVITQEQFIQALKNIGFPAHESVMRHEKQSGFVITGGKILAGVNFDLIKTLIEKYLLLLTKSPERNDASFLINLFSSKGSHNFYAINTLLRLKIAIKHFKAALQPISSKAFQDMMEGVEKLINSKRVFYKRPGSDDYVALIIGRKIVPFEALSTLYTPGLQEKFLDPEDDAKEIYLACNGLGHGAELQKRTNDYERPGKFKYALEVIRFPLALVCVDVQKGFCVHLFEYQANINYREIDSLIDQYLKNLSNVDEIRNANALKYVISRYGEKDPIGTLLKLKWRIATFKPKSQGLLRQRIFKSKSKFEEMLEEIEKKLNVKKPDDIKENKYPVSFASENKPIRGLIKHDLVLALLKVCVILGYKFDIGKPIEQLEQGKFIDALNVIGFPYTEIAKHEGGFDVFVTKESVNLNYSRISSILSNASQRFDSYHQGLVISFQGLVLDKHEDPVIALLSLKQIIPKFKKNSMNYSLLKDQKSIEKGPSSSNKDFIGMLAEIEKLLPGKQASLPEQTSTSMQSESASSSSSTTSSSSLTFQS